MASFFDWHPIEEMGGISAHQAQTINRLMEQGVPLAEIAAAVGLPASLIQQATGYGMNGPNNGGGAEVEAPAATGADTAAGSSNDPIEFIRQWQATHPASQQGFYELANELKTRFGIDRAAGGVGPSNNEFLINGQKIKAYSEGGNSWFDPGGLTPEGDYNPGGGGVATQPYTLGDLYSNPAYTAPEPFSYPSLPALKPFEAPTADSVLNDPGYQFRRNEGEQGLLRNRSATGNLSTGGTLKDLLAYDSGLASQEYGNAWDRAYNTWNTENNNLLNVYGVNRANASDIYKTNLGAGQTGYSLNKDNALSQFQTNLAATQGAWDRNRLAGLDQYGQSQDYLNNLFKFYGLGQSSTGVPQPYQASY
jgi:hypothetical protein